MTATRQVPKDQLAAYFAAFTKKFLGETSRDAVDVEVAAAEWGNQYLAEGVHLAGITYDPRTKALEFALDAGDHRVYQPSEVWIIEEPDGFVNTIEIVRPDDVREIVHVKKVGLRRVS